MFYCSICKCGHLVEKQHTAIVTLKEEKDKMTTMIIVEQRDEFGRKMVKGIKLERFIEFKVRIECDRCGVGCRNLPDNSFPEEPEDGKESWED